MRLEISSAAYEEIKRKLEAAGYQHVFHDEGRLIDMHGIVVAPELANAETPADAAQIRNAIARGSAPTCPKCKTTAHMSQNHASLHWYCKSCTTHWNDVYLSGWNDGWAQHSKATMNSLEQSATPNRRSPASGPLAALWEQYIDAEDERREIRERLENSSSEYQSALHRAQEAWNKIEAAQKEGAAK